MGLYVTLRGGDGAEVRGIPDPFGGTFDAAGDFDELLGTGASALFDAIDPYDVTTFASSEMSTFAARVDALMATIPEDAKARGRKGTAWRGLTRLRLMVELCGSDDRLTLHFFGD